MPPRFQSDGDKLKVLICSFPVAAKPLQHVMFVMFSSFSRLVCCLLDNSYFSFLCAVLVCRYALKGFTRLLRALRKGRLLKCSLFFFPLFEFPLFSLLFASDLRVRRCSCIFFFLFLSSPASVPVQECSRRLSILANAVAQVLPAVSQFGQKVRSNC